ncbi:MAG: hypothetical protein QXF67_00920 [Candidatus Anstonellales archaeon]
MVNIRRDGDVLIFDCVSIPYELFSPSFINDMFHTLSTLDFEPKQLRFEEELVVEFSPQQTKILIDYVKIIRQVDSLRLKKEIYGHPQDDRVAARRKLLSDFYEQMFMNPVLALQTLDDYKEPQPTRSLFVEGYRTFFAWLNGIIKAMRSNKFYLLCREAGDAQSVILSFGGLRSLRYVPLLQLSVPPYAKPLQIEEARYEIGEGLTVQIYETGREAHLYVIENPLIENLKPELTELMKSKIAEELAAIKDQQIVWDTIYETKSREYSDYFLLTASSKSIELSSKQAYAMGREAASWVVGLGSPIENMSLDCENITDIYIDSQNSPIYIEHAKFGLCHTLWRYNTEMLESAFRNIVSLTKESRKFDSSNPVLDVVVRRLNLRCHLQRPPATFGDLQAAFRLSKPTPFTYPQYFYYKSFTPFFTGYDHVMVSLGCSEAVLGIKAVGKTAFTASKILAIGTKKRILPIQDIEEIPVRAYRKRGFHIGAMRVQSSDKEGLTLQPKSAELDLVTMANASLRMGEACLIINEVRSRLALQGVINLLNTQPGVFLLYNLHARSLSEIQDRLEMVFGIPGASMFSTDRYSFLKKLRFGRKDRFYRVLDNSFETDAEQKTFVKVFTFIQGPSIDSSQLKCLFLKNKEASSPSLRGLDLGKMEKNLDIEFIPPVMKRVAQEHILQPEDYIMLSFLYAKIYSDIYDKSLELKNKNITELDFVLECVSALNILLKEKERENGSVDFADLQPEWERQFHGLLSDFLLGKLNAKGKLTSKELNEEEEGEVDN